MSSEQVEQVVATPIIPLTTQEIDQATEALSKSYNHVIKSTVVVTSEGLHDPTNPREEVEGFRDFEGLLSVQSKIDDGKYLVQPKTLLAFFKKITAQIECCHGLMATDENMSQTKYSMFVAGMKQLEMTKADGLTISCESFNVTIPASKFSFDVATIEETYGRVGLRAYGLYALMSQIMDNIRKENCDEVYQSIKSKVSKFRLLPVFNVEMALLKPVKKTAANTVKQLHESVVSNFAKSKEPVITKNTIAFLHENNEIFSEMYDTVLKNAGDLKLTQAKHFIKVVEEEPETDVEAPLLKPKKAVKKTKATA